MLSKRKVATGRSKHLRAYLLELIHVDNSPPVVGDLVQTEGLREVDDVEDVFLEAADENEQDQSLKSQKLFTNLPPNPGPAFNI